MITVAVCSFASCGSTTRVPFEPFRMRGIWIAPAAAAMVASPDAENATRDTLLAKGNAAQHTATLRNGELWTRGAARSALELRMNITKRLHDANYAGFYKSYAAVVSIAQPRTGAICSWLEKGGRWRRQSSTAYEHSPLEALTFSQRPRMRRTSAAILSTNTEHTAWIGCHSRLLAGKALTCEPMAHRFATGLPTCNWDHHRPSSRCAAKPRICVRGMNALPLAIDSSGLRLEATGLRRLYTAQEPADRVVYAAIRKTFRDSDINAMTRASAPAAGSEPRGGKRQHTLHPSPRPSTSRYARCAGCDVPPPCLPPGAAFARTFGRRRHACLWETPSGGSTRWSRSVRTEERAAASGQRASGPCRNVAMFAGDSAAVISDCRPRSLAATSSATPRESACHDPASRAPPRPGAAAANGPFTRPQVPAGTASRAPRPPRPRAP
jgi:hypothetical protein